MIRRFDILFGQKQPQAYLSIKISSYQNKNSQHKYDILYMEGPSLYWNGVRGPGDLKHHDVTVLCLASPKSHMIF